jgi:hypothetical protein
MRRRVALLPATASARERALGPTAQSLCEPDPGLPWPETAAQLRHLGRAIAWLSGNPCGRAPSARGYPSPRAIRAIHPSRRAGGTAGPVQLVSSLPQ